MREFFVVALLLIIGWLIFTDEKADATKPERYKYERVNTISSRDALSTVNQLGAEGYRVIGVVHTGGGLISQVLMERKY